MAMLVGLMPALAMAANANPEGATDWELYVYGNGHVIYDIFTGIKLLMVPDGGESGFRTLLLVLATIGFLTMAIAAGFDPGKNLMKMFAYVFVVWGVIFASTGLTSNVLVVDLVRPEGSATGQDYRVENAPALVVIPAAFTSSVGKYFTEAMETYYSTPDAFKMTGGAVAQFNLFGKMVSETTQYKITSSELKRSLTAYNSDCVVSAIALGKFKGPGIDPTTGQKGTLYGVQALVRSTEMKETLASAKNAAILTKYFPYSPTETGWIAIANSETEVKSDPASLALYSGSGVLVSCEAAWKMIEIDLQNHAQRLYEGGAEAWEKTGTSTTYETLFTSMLEKAAAPMAANGQALYTSPQSFILQTAMVNSARGTFRSAAINTGNNEILAAVNLSQAEHNQKSAWASAVHTFNFMMGYVYTVLQAFIFALTPMIVVALFIPGMGRSIFVNYAQILVWLTLWQPLLSIINFIMVLFGSETLSSTMGEHGGYTMSNDALISEKTSDLVTAAGFLGAMIPMLSWGIVKGAMAFTEFINAGMGTTFATQAGMATASGNVSMGNIQMNNVGMNKYSTTMSSAIGSQAVSADLGAGAATLMQNLGGMGLSANAASVQQSQQLNNQVSSSLAQSKAIGEALSTMASQGWSDSQVISQARSNDQNSALTQAAQLILAQQKSVSNSSGYGETESKSNTAGKQDQRDESGSSGNGATASIGLGAPGVSPIKGGIEKRAQASYEEGASSSRSAGENFSGTSTADHNKTTAGTSDARTLSDTTSNTFSNSTSSSQGASKAMSANMQEAFSKAVTANTTMTEQLQQVQSVTSNFSANQGLTIGDYQRSLAEFNQLQSQYGAQLAAGSQAAAGLGGQLQSNADAITQRREEISGNAAGMLGGAGPAPHQNATTLTSEGLDARHAQEQRTAENKFKANQTGRAAAETAAQPQGPAAAVLKNKSAGVLDAGGGTANPGAALKSHGIDPTRNLPKKGQ